MKNKLFIKTVFLLTLCFPLFTSCSDDNNDGGTEANIIVSVNQNNLLTTSSEPFTFTVTDEAGNDVTSESTIYVAGSAIEGSSYATSEIGSYDVYATKGDLTSNTLSVSVALSLFNYNVLIEDITGTWCGWCPRVSEAIERVKAQTDRVVVAALHSGSSDPNNGYYDPYNINSGSLDTGSYPQAYINRITWTSPETTNVSQAIEKINQNANSPYGIAISSELGANSGSINVSFAFSTDAPTNIKYVVYVAENGLIFKQANYTNFYNSENPITDFEHEHVVRVIANEDVTGTAIPSESTTNGSEYSVELDTSYTSENVDNLEITVIMLSVDEEGNTIDVLNSRSVPANIDVDYDVIE